MDSFANGRRASAPSLDDIWREHRSHLLNVAFRMLGNIGDAEDVVQEAFTRLLDVDVGAINDLRGWLVVVVSRLCLDHLGTARVRRETQQPHDSAAFARPARTPDPADRVTLDDNIRIALLVVLQELSPAERTVFVLHDVFQYPFDTVAEIVGRTPAACRQLARRARQHIDNDATSASRFQVDPAAEDRVAERFVAACAGGELAPLMQLLDPDVVGYADLGGGAQRELRGREVVAPNLLRFFGGPAVTLVTHPVNGRTGALAFRGRRLVAVVELETRGDVVTDVHARVEPELLAAVSSVLEGNRE